MHSLNSTIRLIITSYRLLFAAIYGFSVATHAQTVVFSNNFDSYSLGAFGGTYNDGSGGNVTATIVAPGEGGTGQALQLSGNVTNGLSENAGVNSPLYAASNNTDTNLSDYTLSFDLAITHGANSGVGVTLNIFGGTAQANGSSYAVPISQNTVGGGFQHYSVNMGTLPAGYEIGALVPTSSQYQFQLLFLGYDASVTATPETIELDNLQITVVSNTNTNTGSQTATVNSTKVYQTIEGLGGATAFYAGWIPAHPYAQEIYTNAFAGLNLSMLRLGDWFRYQTPEAGFDSAAFEIVSNANVILGHPVPVFMSSWSPPAFLKSNGQTGNGGTLLYTNGGFDYTGFAQYWYDSIQAYQSNRVSLTWMSIQNEPDWAASYDSCIFYPTEETVGGTNYASYSDALNATHELLTNLPSPPKILAPECVGIGYNDVQNFAATMNGASFYGITHHLYGGSTDGSPDGYTANLSALTNVFPSKPHFMTEFGYPDMMNTACLIHDCLTIEQDVGFNYWSLVWPVGGDGLVQIENPYDLSSWTNAPPGVTTQSHGWWLTPAYWGMKHFSYFIQPGYRRVSASDSDPNVRSSAYLSPDGLRLVVVLINTNATASSTMNFNFGTFNVGNSSVYQTAGTNTYAGTNTFLPLGSLTSPQVLPPLSLTTVVLNENLHVGPATNPSPAQGATGVALSAPLSWTPGSNAESHAVYLGVNSNAVAQATPASPQFLGIMTNTNFFAPLNGGTACYWRVDEIAGINTNAGLVWSFSTEPAPSLLHRYSFSETGGTNTADSVGGPAWTGTLPNGGTLSGGQLALSSSSQQYVSLPAGIVGTLSNFTMAAWVRLASTANWARIFDFGDNTTVYMFLTPQNGTTGTVRFAITTNSTGGEQQINCNSVLTTNVWHQVAVTLNSHTGTLYVDGVPVGTNSAMTLNPLIQGGTSNNYLGKSQWNDPCLNGSMDEFRIYSAALSSAEIAATYALGPGQLFSTNNPAMAVSMSGKNLTMSWPVASAGYTLQSCTNLAPANWEAVSSPAPQIVGTNYQVTLPATNTAQFFRLSM